MKRLSILLLFVCSFCFSKAQSEPCTFVEAKPVWSKGRETEKNLFLSFREVIEVGRVEAATIRLTASCNYRLRVNGEFVGHGPCVAAHDFYRIDSYELKPYLHRGKNIIAIEVAGYNVPSYYLLDQPSFLQAEVEVNGKVIAATGRSFETHALGQRLANVPKFSFQRTSTEEYILSAEYLAWATKVRWQPSVKRETLVEQEHKALLARGVAYPDYRLHGAKPIDKNLYKFATNSSGFLRAKIKVKKPTNFTLRFDEILGDNGRVMERRLRWKPYIVYNLQAGEYELESFEPYTMQYVEIFAEEGAVEVEDISMRDYCNSDCYRAKFESSSADLNFIFEAARETYRQNAIDIYMDCPSRERAGWLCDSYFTGRVEFAMSGKSRIECNFIENYLLPKQFKDIDKGMLPMCYPADHRNHNYIPNWAMWFVLELEEYLERTGDVETIHRARTRIYELVEFFKPYLNESGLLEKLPKWVFVEYSYANKLVQDVSYPSNMLYAEMLDVVSRLYGDKALAEQAANIRHEVLKQSFDGEYFVDNAVRNKQGVLVPSGKHTEVCQYYAFLFGVATPESHPLLWKRLRDEVVPGRVEKGLYTDLYPINAFIGSYLRLELLSKYGLSKQILDESIATYKSMADRTGTLWESLQPKASCNHGFASHLTNVLYRDVLGVYEVQPCERKVRLRFIDSGLEWCRGSIPVGEEQIDVEWHYKAGKFDVKLNLPKGYTYEIISTECKVEIR
jgi:hypothetical protein